MNFCLGLGLGQLKSEGSKWKLTSEGSGGSKWRLEAKAKNKNEMNFCLGPFALVLHAYAAAATYAKARLGLGQVTSGGSKCSKSNKNTKCTSKNKNKSFRQKLPLRCNSHCHGNDQKQRLLQDSQPRYAELAWLANVNRKCDSNFKFQNGKRLN
jgi:hypothetical protein